MTTEKKPKLEDYFAGAALSNSLAWLTLAVATASEIDLLTLAWLSPFLYALGAVISGYMVSRKATQDHLKVGFKTGLGAFIFHIYILVGVFELFWGRRVLSFYDHLLIFAIFIIAASFGAFLCQQLSFIRINEGGASGQVGAIRGSSP